MNSIAFWVSIGVLLLLMIVFCIVGYLLVQGMLTVPWVRTNRRMSRKMLELLNFQRGDRVLDLGSGDGSIVFEAVAMGGEGIGVERLGLLVWYARVLARMKNMQRNMELSSFPFPNPAG